GRVLQRGHAVSGDLDPDVHPVQGRQGGGPRARGPPARRVRQVHRPQHLNPPTQEVERAEAPAARGGFPSVPSFSLDTLWFQVAGTLCNLACPHCFISCSPTNASHGMLSLEDVKVRLAEARSLGVREYYFTGGEPFMNPEMLPILEETLRQGPATVLTNG